MMSWGHCVIIHLLLLVSSRHSFEYYDYYDYSYDETLQDERPLLTVLLGSSFVVPCSVTSDDINLYHNDSLVEESRYSEVSGGYLIQHAQSQDSGQYHCSTDQVTRVVVLPRSQSPVIIVNDQLLLTSAELSVVEDDLVSPVCVLMVSDDGVDSLSWSVDDHVVSDTQDTVHHQDHISLRLKPLRVSRDHRESVLRCSSDQETVELRLSVEYPPQFTISREPQFGSPVTVGSSVSLMCQVDSAPLSSAYWEHNGVELTNTSHLLIPRLTLEHEGWYQCNANHKLGNYSSVGYFLTVQEKSPLTPVSPPSPCSDNDQPRPPHVFTPQHNISAITGQNVTIYSGFCSSSASPPTIIWTGPRVLLRQDHDHGADHDHGRVRTGLVSQDSNCSTLSLVMEEVDAGDSGSYTLLVSSEEGAGQGRVWLEVSTGGAQMIVSSAAPGYCDIVISLLLILPLLFLHFTCTLHIQ